MDRHVRQVATYLSLLACGFFPYLLAVSFLAHDSLITCMFARVALFFSIITFLSRHCSTQFSNKRIVYTSKTTNTSYILRPKLKNGM